MSLGVETGRTMVSAEASCRAIWAIDIEYGPCADVVEMTRRGAFLPLNPRPWELPFHDESHQISDVMSLLW